MFTRRAFFGLAAALAALPRRARAADTAERRFLFVLARGGWDPTYVFTPGLDPATVDLDAEGEDAEVGGLAFRDAPTRPSVRSFLEKYGGLTSFVNGLEVRSLTHERCRRLLFCGEGEGEADDWPTLIAAADARWRLPHLVLTGPSFTAAHGAAVVRLGQNNQLAELLSGRFVDRADRTLAVPSSAAAEAARAFARGRAERWAAAQAGGQPAAFGEALLGAYDQLDLVRSNADLLDIGLDVGTDRLVPVPVRVAAALQCFEAGYSRCALVEHLGLYDQTWDSHSSNSVQSAHFELLFSDLTAILDEMAARPGLGGGTLLDETTVVVLSEMGRTPRLNAADGKDHWTFTSAMLLGAGVRGGTVVGGYDDALYGLPIDLGTGRHDDAGAALTPEHLGATLFALAGLDPDAAGAEPIAALLEDG
jgi:hypothetical protein